MRTDLRVRNYSPHTEQVYLQQVAWYVEYFKRSPLELDLDHVAVRETLLTLGKNNLGVTRAPPKLVPRLKKALWRDHFVEYSRSHLKSA